MAKSVDSWTPGPQKPKTTVVPAAPRHRSMAWRRLGRALVLGALIALGAGFVLYGATSWPTLPPPTAPTSRLEKSEFFAPSIPAFTTEPAPREPSRPSPPSSNVAPQPHIQVADPLGDLPELPEEAYELARLRLRRTAQGALLERIRAGELDFAERLDPEAASRFAADYLKLHPTGAARGRAESLLRTTPAP